MSAPLQPFPSRIVSYQQETLEAEGNQLPLPQVVNYYLSLRIFEQLDLAGDGVKGHCLEGPGSFVSICSQPTCLGTTGTGHDKGYSPVLFAVV